MKQYVGHEISALAPNPRHNKHITMKMSSGYPEKTPALSPIEIGKLKNHFSKPFHHEHSKQS